MVKQGNGARTGRKRTGTLIRQNGMYYLRVIVDGKAIKRSLGVKTLREAQALKEAKLAELGLGVREKEEMLTGLIERLDVERAKRERIDKRLKQDDLEKRRLNLDSVWPAYLQSPKRPDSGASTLRQYSFQWHQFVEWLNEKHSDISKLADVTSDMAEAYASHLANGRKLSAGTYNKHVRLCRLVCRVLMESQGMTVNPFDGLSSKRESQNHRREIAWDVLGKICDSAEGELKTLLFLGIYSGQRLGDCCLLTWDEVDLVRGWLLITPNKTRSRGGTPLHIPILPSLRAVLEATPPDARSGYILPGLASAYTKSRDKVTNRIQNLFRDCGVQVYKPGTGPGTKKRAVLQYGFHSLRHTTVSLLQEAGVAQAVVQAIVGHRTVAMTARYTHIGREAISTAMAKLPAIGETADPCNGDQRTEARRLIETADHETLAQVLAILQNQK